MEYEVVNVGEKTVDGILIQTQNADGKAIADIAALWNDFFGSGKAGLIRGRINDNFVGLYTDYEGDFTKPYAYIAGGEVEGSETPAFTAKKIAAGKYAKFVAKGNLEQEVGAIWNAVWSLPFKRSYKSDFEEYIGSDGVTGEIHIYIGIED
ncbi:MAG: effector binding domain-containing protein [Christensenella sp.]|uniref:GyrI-like domain-containing protein n=1 Tax=Christensenella sp. TaxID=1935934 RepID=UPI002B201D60|nr:effector binding domain-containing protein [Christensenella sp.]MEA5003893.1 effector binding domain-containing protein [Christensenella sp.]